MVVLPKIQSIGEVNKIEKWMQEMLEKSKCCTKIEEMNNLINALGRKILKAE